MRLIRCHKCWINFAWVTILVAFLLLWMVLLLNTVNRRMPIVAYQSIRNTCSTSENASRQNDGKLPSEVSDVKAKIALLASKIFKAKKHVRGIKTADNLKSAWNLLEGILKDLNIDATPLKQRTAVQARSICPEEYKGTTYGYPFFYKGFEVTDCDFAKPLTDLLTITAYIKEDVSDNVENAVTNLVSSIKNLNSKYRIAIAADIALATVDRLTKRFPNTIIKDAVAIKGLSAGQIWNSLVQTATTEYVLIARDVEVITNDTRFDRLIREIESMDLSAGGGAFRTPNGHWSNGCYQIAYKNYSLSYHHGYDESMHECLFCDYIEGPFITTKNRLETTQFNKLDETHGLFEDWFMRMHDKQQSVVVCPDSMFHTFYKTTDKENWDSFMKAWGLYRMHTPLGTEIVSSCHTGTPMSRSKALHPCASDSLAKAVKFLMTTCEETNIICELEEGTALGAVKFNKILPWERDADITFLTANYSAFQKLAATFSKVNYRLANVKEPRCCVDNRKAGGVFNLYLSGWHIEIYGQHIMDSELLRVEGFKPTKILLDGQWVSVPRNPGLFMRNRYGHEIYRHALHWLSLGEKTGWVNYQTTKFLECEQPGHHACIDRYNTDGNLQFQLKLP